VSDLAALAALGAVPAARARLDARELDLIETARAAGATWADVADALGLRSRQAAEQRWGRLRRSRQQNIDSTAIAELRLAAEDLRLWMASRDDFPRATLVRGTLEAAIGALPGSLFSLVKDVVGDLEGVSGPAVDRLRSAFRAATPKT
jgi:hypothetical protein